METLSEQIYRELYEDITEQRLRCGQKLTLKMLKERFQVSHTPIREALMRLTEGGLVTYYSNCGVTVTEFTEDDIYQLYQFAGEMDALAIRFCEVSSTPLVMDLQEVLAAGERAIETRDMVLWKSSSEQFHIAFYRHARNAYLDEAVFRMRARLDLLAGMYYSRQNIRKIQDQHAGIFAQVQEGRFTAAASRMRRHLQYDMACALKAYSQRERA